MSSLEAILLGSVYSELMSSLYILAYKQAYAAMKEACNSDCASKSTLYGALFGRDQKGLPSLNLSSGYT